MGSTWTADNPHLTTQRYTLTNTLMKLCYKCHERPRTAKYCNPCSAEYARKWRATHPLNEEQKRKDACRSYANVYLKRGKLSREPCRQCGSHDSQMHHPDYTQPLNVEWLCRKCHLAHHRSEKAGLTYQRVSLILKRMRSS